MVLASVGVDKLAARAQTRLGDVTALMDHRKVQNCLESVRKA